MEIKEMEETLSKIRSREDYLARLKNKDDIYASYWGMCNYCTIFTLSDEEKEYLKQSCIKEIKRLRKSIECLTDEKN